VDFLSGDLALGADADNQLSDVRLDFLRAHCCGGEDACE
jgi:hypothetical protein